MTAEPFELVAVDGSRVEETWAMLRLRPGIVPILLGERASAESALELRRGNTEGLESIKARALALDVEQWIAQRVEQEPDYFEVDRDPSGEVSPNRAFSPAYHYSGKPLPEVFFGLIPVEAAWLVPAWLGFGGWNDCPEAVVQVAFFKRWYERYGAELTSIAGDVVECRVTRPPASAEAANVLAWEQFVYCTDIVHQGVNTLGNLAAVLRASPNWFFWWD